MNKLIKLAQELDVCFEVREKKNNKDETECFVCIKEEKIIGAEHHRICIDLVYKDISGFANDFDYSNTWEAISILAGLPEDKEIDEDLVNELFDDNANKLVSDYNYDLTKWLNDKVSNIYYLSDALQEMSFVDGFELLRYAQYLAIKETFYKVFNQLKEITGGE